MIINGFLYILDDRGTLTLAPATPTGYAPVTQAKVLAGPDAWAPMAHVDGRLILRDLKTMICLDIAGH